LKFLDRALDMEPTNCQALETKALVFLEMDRTDEAHTLFLTAAELEPSEGPSKFMYLGQLSAGQEAAAFIRKGTEIMAASIAEVCHRRVPTKYRLTRRCERIQNAHPKRFNRACPSCQLRTVR
jgi:hypothetical protein